MSRHTKVVCTIGPAVDTVDKMVDLIEAGMNVARINFSHGSHEEHLITIERLKEARAKTNSPLAIMADTKGPEVRLGKITEKPLILPKGHKWLLVKEGIEGSLEKVSVKPGEILDSLQQGTKVLFDDGFITGYVIGRSNEGVIISIEDGGPISSNKGINIPGVDLDLPAMTVQDVSDIEFCCLHDVDIIAASFVRSADHLVAIKRLLAENGKPNILVIAKIENHLGVKNFDSIVQVSDGIMIARGDLGVEVSLSQVPRLQKMMIRKSYLGGKPSVTATQMLESMINNPRPTRAEASDIANAIYDSTSSVMLSGETAVGKYPIEAVNVMCSIIREAEADFDYRTFFQLHAPLVFHDVPSAVTLATVKTAYSSNAKAIFAFTTTGSTARLISRLRPPMPIIAMTHDEKSYNQLAFNWGVVPFLCEKCETVQEAFSKVSAFALENNYVSYGDLVVITAGSPFGIRGTTNMMIVESIGEVLARGYQGIGFRIYGNAHLVFAPEEANPYDVRNQILVIASCDESYLPFIKEASAVILQNHIDDTLSEQYLLNKAKEFGKPVIVRADAAMRVLKNGQLVTLDPDKALVYKGVVL